MSTDAWARIWEERGRDYPEDDPALIGGLDQPFSRLTPAALEATVEWVVEKLDLSPADVFLDLGCGAGMLLSRLAHRVSVAWGTDQAASLVERTKQIFPGLQVRQAEARALPFDTGTFDKVLIYGVTQYFPDERYLTEALDEAFRVCRPAAAVLIGEIMDLDTRDEYLLARERLAGSTPTPRWRSSIQDEVSHLYLRRTFFERLAADRGWRCEVSQRDSSTDTNVNRLYRFDVLLVRTA